MTSNCASLYLVIRHRVSFKDFLYSTKEGVWGLKSPWGPGAKPMQVGGLGTNPVGGMGNKVQGEIRGRTETGAFFAEVRFLHFSSLTTSSKNTLLVRTT